MTPNVKEVIIQGQSYTVWFSSSKAYLVTVKTPGKTYSGRRSVSLTSAKAIEAIAKASA